MLKNLVVSLCTNKNFISIDTSDNEVLSLELQKSIREKLLSLCDENSEKLIRCVSYGVSTIFISRSVKVIFDWKDFGPTICDAIKECFLKFRIDVSFHGYEIWK